MTSKPFYIIFICCIGSLLLNCKTSDSAQGLKEGDLLFQNLNCGALCDAIEAVTEGIDGKDFSHCALVVKVNDTLKVVEAIGSQVQIISITNFFARSGDTTNIKNITVARLKNQHQLLVGKAMTEAKQLIGKPYDDAFLIDNEKWYCSELIYEVFKKANSNNNFFELAPMTFKDPKTGQYFPAWISYYKEMNTTIPEGKPGLNPGLISRSDKIDILPINNFKDLQYK